MLKQARLAYFAGIIDGEGSIQIWTRGKQKSLILAVTMGMCNPLVPYALKAEFGGTVAVRPPRQCNNKYPFWVWRVMATKALACLEAIYPYLIEKKQQAEIGISFQSHGSRGNRRKSEQQKAVEEAQRILLKSYHKGG